LCLARALEQIGHAEQALQLAEQQGYIRSFIDEGDRMAGLLSRYAELRQNGIISGEKGPALRS
jgi:hypothetical protein